MSTDYEAEGLQPESNQLGSPPHEPETAAPSASELLQHESQQQSDQELGGLGEQSRSEHLPFSPHTAEVCSVYMEDEGSKMAVRSAENYYGKI